MGEGPEVPAEVLEAAILAYNERARDLREHGPDTLLAAVQVAYTAGRDSARAEVAAEIREESLTWCMDGTGRHLVENCARIAEGRADG